jgi:aminoglycoside phosphotransferase family enzyme
MHLAGSKQAAGDKTVCSREGRMTKGRNRSAQKGDRTGHGVTLAAKVAFLSRPDPYPGAAKHVEVVETHMSLVFLTELFAHKLKKPVFYEFLDFRTLEARRHSCREEIRLNRRLAPHVYIAAVPLVIDAAGDLHLDRKGEAVDWLVRMHRLPSERMLDRAILEGSVRVVELRAVARLLAEFYRQAIPIAIPLAGFRHRLADAIAQNRRELGAAEFDLPATTVATVCEALCRTLNGDASLFEQRVHLGCVVEGHGDLRPEHVYLGPEPAIIDCLEFNRDFRILDWADELAYLAMECERLGSAGTGKEILETCCRELDDRPPPLLIDFYRAYRALLRARLAILHLRDETVRDPGKWRLRTMEYLELAESYAGRLS